MNTDHKIAISFDVEDWYHTPVITGYSFSAYPDVNTFFKHWDKEYDYVTDAFVNLFNLLAHKKITATFFLVADMIERYPRIMELLKRSSHEIACHSLHHQIPLNPKTNQLMQTPEEWKRDLIISKQLIENYFGKPVIGYRAPGAYVADWMIDILHECGFKYDSSIAFNSIYNKTNVKLKAIPTSAYYINNKTLGPDTPATTLLELPWNYYETGNIKLPGGGAFFYRLLGNTYFKKVLKQSLSKGDTMFYMHPLDFSELKFPIHNHWKRPMYWVNKGNRSLNMLSRLIDSFEGKWATCEEVYNRNKKELQNKI